MNDKTGGKRAFRWAGLNFPDWTDEGPSNLNGIDTGSPLVKSVMRAYRPLATGAIATRGGGS